MAPSRLPEAGGVYRGPLHRSRGGGDGRADPLAGLPEQLRLELLFIAQQFSLQKRKSSREAWRGLVRDGQAAGVGSLLGLERKPASARTTGQVLMVRKLAQRELEVLYADPESEFTSDVWDLRKVGLAAGRNTSCWTS